MYKTDKTGVPVYYERIGAVDVKCVLSFFFFASAHYSHTATQHLSN